MTSNDRDLQVWSWIESRGGFFFSTKDRKPDQISTIAFKDFYFTLR